MLQPSKSNKTNTFKLNKISSTKLDEQNDKERDNYCYEHINFILSKTYHSKWYFVNTIIHSYLL